MCTAIVGRITGTATEIRAASKVLDLLEFSPDQAQKIGLSQNPDGTMSWVNEQSWDIGFDDKSLAMVRQSVTNYTGWAARDSKRVDDLLTKLAPSE